MCKRAAHRIQQKSGTRQVISKEGLIAIASNNIKVLVEKGLVKHKCCCHADDHAKLKAWNPCADAAKRKS